MLDASEARIDRDPLSGRERLSMAFGEKIPYLDATIVPAVGNSPNAAVAAARLGLSSALVSNLGADRNGKDCLESLRRDGVHTHFVRQHENKKSNYHYVLSYGAERTILIKHEPYPYTLPEFAVPPRYIYFSSIGKHGLQLHHDIATYIARNPETKLVFQPGTFQLRLGHEALRNLYAVTELFFCNKEEAQELLHTETTDMPTLLRGINAFGPKIVVITDGTRGAHARDADGATWFMPAYPDPKPPVERTGAGDAFSSTVTIALAQGLPLREALRWGPVNSMNVVQHIGAQAGLFTRPQLEERLAAAPDWYQPKRIG